MAVTEFGYLAMANAEIRAARRKHELDKRERQVTRRRIGLIDQLIADLEILNLKSVERVPLAYEKRLAELRAVLADSGVPLGQLDGLRTRIRISRLMDHAFGVQETLFATLRPGLPEEMAEWEASDSSRNLQLAARGADMMAALEDDVERAALSA